MKSNEFLRENKNNAFIKQHIQWVADQVGIEQLPKIVLLDKPTDTTFGQYDPEEKVIKLVTGGRHPVDVLRTLAHELRHHKQNLEGDLTDGAGETGTDQENDANSTAGIVLRDFAKENPQYFGLNKEEPLDEAFTSKVPYKVIKDTAYDFSTVAKIGDREIVFRAEKETQIAWMIDFVERKDEYPGSTSFAVTGSGNAMEVFSFVIASIKELITRYSPGIIQFDANKAENSRIDLYRRMINRVKIPGYSAYSAGGSDKFATFRIDKLKEPLDEASYEGNIGVMEMMKFFQIANEEQKTVLKALIKSNKKELAWDLIQKVTGIALHAISESTDGSVILTEKWVHLGKFGKGWTWGIGDHFMERWHQPERNCPWAYIERIIKRLPFVKPKLEQMLNFPQFYLRDSKTGVELGCKISTFGQPETKLVYINTIVIKPSERKGAQSPIIIVN